MFFGVSQYVYLTTRCYTTSHLHQVFFRFRIFSLFSLVFRTSNFWSLRNLIKQLFHSRLLDMRLVIAKSTLRASLAAIYHLISNARSWNNQGVLAMMTEAARKTSLKKKHLRNCDYFAIIPSCSHYTMLTKNPATELV